MTGNKEIKEMLSGGTLVLDGAMGTMVQRLGLTEADFRGDRFASHPVNLSGCNDLLVLTRPEKIAAIHRAYLDAGADIITTDSFNANAVSMADYGLGDDPGFIVELNRAAAAVARAEADKAPLRPNGRKALVAGSVGPTNRTASMSPDVNDPAMRNVDYDTLFNTYADQITGLVEGGADLILFETVFDTLNLKAGLAAALSVARKMDREIPVMVSATVADKSGRTLSGQTLRAFVDTVEGFDNIVSLGLNCSFGPADIIVHLRELASLSPVAVSCHPNAGLPNELGQYDETPESFAGHVSKILDEGLVNIAGGCCGTTPDHIRAIAGKVHAATPHMPVVRRPALRVTGLESLEVIPENNFVNVGERCNVAGSRKFLRLINEKKYDEALEIAARQVEDGAMMIDVNMDDPLIDARAEMTGFLRRMAAEPEIARVPVMIDSSQWDVVTDALKNTQGKCIVNSISLKEGEEAFVSKGRAIRELGGAVIVMAFDEQGQADTYARKIEIAKRAYDLLTKECGFNPDDIIIDVNIMAVATGIEEHNRYGIDFIEAVRWIKENLAGARTSGGVSNLSFAFRGKNRLREAMHAVFLYHAIGAGLDMAILNPATAVTYEDIEPGLRDLIEDVILARNPEAADRLMEYAAGQDSKAESKGTAERDMSIPVGTRLENAIVKGHGEYLDVDLKDMLDMGLKPVEIISGPLMEGMNHVGQLFGEGKMFLPQVVKTARTMRKAVDFLKPYMEADTDGDAPKNGKVLFATVKGDVHDIGKNIVAIVMACNNYEVIDLGVMVPAETIVETALKEKPDLICLSGLITPSLAEMANTVRALDRAGVNTPVMVGGATTSALHTALKIATETQAPVIHVTDASQNPLIAAKLNDCATAKGFVDELKERQQKLRDDYAAQKVALHTLEKARADAFKTTWKGPDSHPAGGFAKDVDLDDIVPLIDWKMFLHAWRLNVKDAAEEADKLLADARHELELLRQSGKFDGKRYIEVYEAYRSGDDIVFEDHPDRKPILRLPMLRQQSYDGVSLSLADYVADKETGDEVGVFAVTAGRYLEDEVDRLNNEGNTYRALLLQTLADRLAEATAVYTGKSTGAVIRPAIGYPMIPDQELNHSLATVLPLDQLGMNVVGNGAMTPKASVAGLLVFNPEAKYFMVGRIGEDQIRDYAERRGVSVERIKNGLRQ